jgi:hypothetical protein
MVNEYTPTNTETIPETITEIPVLEPKFSSPSENANIIPVTINTAVATKPIMPIKVFHPPDNVASKLPKPPRIPNTNTPKIVKARIHPLLFMLYFNFTYL